jgi:hypothetical protein
MRIMLSDLEDYEALSIEGHLFVHAVINLSINKVRHMSVVEPYRGTVSRNRTGRAVWLVLLNSHPEVLLLAPLGSIQK